MNESTLVVIQKDITERKALSYSSLREGDCFVFVDRYISLSGLRIKTFDGHFNPNVGQCTTSDTFARHTVRLVKAKIVWEEIYA